MKNWIPHVNFQAESEICIAGKSVGSRNMYILIHSVGCLVAGPTQSANIALAARRPHEE